MRTPYRPLIVAVLATLAFGGCARYEVVVPPGPGPGPTPPGPVDPRPPGPVDPTPPGPRPTPVGPVVPEGPILGVVPYAVAHGVHDGEPIADVRARIGFAPVLTTRRDDGTEVQRWAAVGPTGAARWLDVVYAATGTVLGYALVPRVP